MTSLSGAAIGSVAGIEAGWVSGAKVADSGAGVGGVKPKPFGWLEVSVAAGREADCAGSAAVRVEAAVAGAAVAVRAVVGGVAVAAVGLGEDCAGASALGSAR